MSDSTPSPVFTMFDRVASFGATIAWSVIALVTFVDVIGREVFASPISGGYEIIQALMTIGVFFSLPIVALRRGHVSVDLLRQKYPPQLARGLSALVAVAGLAFFGFLAWSMASFAKHALGTGEHTAFLFIPIWLVAAVMAAMLSVTALCCLLGREAQEDSADLKEI